MPVTRDDTTNTTNSNNNNNVKMARIGRNMVRTLRIKYIINTVVRLLVMYIFWMQGEILCVRSVYVPEQVLTYSMVQSPS